MIIYIHGFGSSGFGGKATSFQEYFKKDIILPSLSYVPNLAINTLEQIIEFLLNNNHEVNLVGSSLGGYYSIYLADKYDLKAVLINPAVTPYKTLDKVGMAVNYFDMSSFEVTSSHLVFLKELDIDKVKNEKNFMLFLQKGDELLNFEDAVKKLPHSYLDIEEKGTHSYENIQRHFKKIEQFFD